MDPEDFRVEPTITEQIFAGVCVVCGGYILYTAARDALRYRKFRKDDAKFDANLLATDPQK